jgi:rhamnosyl/mannosyltransferase
LRYYKGLHILLDAAKGLDYPIVIAGAGPIEAELKAQATRLGLKNIHFIGKVSDEDKVTLLTLCYGVVFPSHLRSEAFGISLLEGAMFGKPMISSEIGTGTTFINIKDETGLVIPPNDSNALRNAMQYLWENEDTAKLMGQRAEQRYWNYFTAQEMVSSYVKLYQSVIDNFRM